ncbi:MAG: amidohydrolase [Oscillospiraceae bacterium]|nr:amidohydrolase [Oscillospiraceae bacterium]
MDIFDFHMHLPTNFPTIEEKKKALLAEMKRNGVSKGVAISDSAIESEIGSLRECAETFSDTDNIFVVGGISPFFDYEKQLALLEKFISEKKVSGIKIYCGHEPIYLDDEKLKPVYRIAEKYGVPVLFHSGWDNPQYSSPEVIKRTAALHLKVKFVCCHCCYPKLGESFEKLAEFKNVYFDLSSTADNPVIYNEVKAAVENAVHNIPKRIIFGSDFASCDQRTHIEFFMGLDISDNEKSLIFYKNAEEILSINGI